MPKQISLPDGSVGEFPDEMSDDAIKAVLVKKFPAQPKAEEKPKANILERALAGETLDPAAGMSGWQKFVEGAKGSAKDLYLGAKNLVGAGTPEDVEERKRIEHLQPYLGGSGVAGSMVGDIASTLPVAGAVTKGAKVLTKALPALEKAGSVGGRVANLGLVGRGATEGALTAGIRGDIEDEGLADRLNNVVTGGIVGAALPAAATGGSAILRKGWKEFGPTERAATARAASAFEKTLGKERVGNIIESLENPTPSQLPRTTAAMSQDPYMGALERGAQGRSNVDFSLRREAANQEALKRIEASTQAGTPVNLDSLRKAPQEIFNAGVEQLDKLPLSQANREKLTQDLVELRTHRNVVGNPELNREIDSLIGSIADPNAKLGTLAELHTRLDDLAGQYPAMKQAKTLIKNAADERSKGQFTNIIEGYGATKDQLKAAEAAAGLREQFLSQGSSAPKSQSLHKALDAIEKGAAGPHMDPTSMANLRSLADDLHGQEIYKPGRSMGSTQFTAGGALDVVSDIPGVGWKLKAVLKPFLGNLDEKAQRIADQALDNPQQFLSVMQMKRGTGIPLTPTEQLLDQTLRGLSRSAAVSTGE